DDRLCAAACKCQVVALVDQQSLEGLAPYRFVVNNKNSACVAHRHPPRLCPVVPLPFICSSTLLALLEPLALFQSRHIDRLLTWLARSTKERLSGDDRFILALLGVVKSYNMRHLVDMIAAYRPPAEATCAMGRAFTIPAVHSMLPPIIDEITRS